MLGRGTHTEKQNHQQFVIFITLTVKCKRLKEHLKDFRGVLHADAYSGYDQLYQSQDNPEAEMIKAGFWFYTRRKFY